MAGQYRLVVVFHRQNFTIFRPVFLLLAFICSTILAQDSAVPCYDGNGRAQRCQPEFVNAAFELDVEATNTCGLYRASRYCRQTGVTGATRACSYCDASSRRFSHPPKYLTDYHKEKKMTWWQSDTMFEGIQFPNSVNLTISLGKAFSITYIRLKFYSARPESFAIYKRTSHDGPWIPYQFYSGSCETTYRVPRSNFAPPDDETRVLCTDDFSDISPLTGGNIAFGTLEGRPSAFNFDDSKVLQEWVTATDILVMLTRLNTFGDEVFQVPDVLRSYYYAISDFSIGGRCKCNGHASECINSTGIDSSVRLVCRCEHFTAGVDCNECLPFYNDQPWKPATSVDANECQACDCNGRSNRCYFDRELYDRTGHGGHCQDCEGNTDGPNCERCRDNYFQTSSDAVCQPCNCDPVGSLNLQCNSQGQCSCKIGVGGDKCNQCLPNYYDFGVAGCRSCECVVAGSVNNEPSCDSTSGFCNCKVNVEGRRCDRCKSGYFNLQEDDPFGCMSCFCHGHSSDCSSAPGYEFSYLQSKFNTDDEGWRAMGRYGQEGVLVYNSIRRDIGIASDSNRPYYFVASAKYLGDKRLAYGQDMTFTFRHVGAEPSLTVEDVILMGSGLTISAPIVAQENPAPSVLPQKYTFKLREEDELGWVQRPSAFDLQRLLSNLTAVMIRATYAEEAQGIIDNFDFPTVRRAVGPGAERVDFVELCQCPVGYIGQFCESCDGKFRRDPPGGGPYAQCIPCECNGHADFCEESSGICICQDNTIGDQCERCAPGFYGDATQGGDDDCQPCPCPGGSECMQMPSTGEVMCTNCPMGYVGNRCEFCADGFFGDPLGLNGQPRACTPCQCNGNIDENAVGNCDRDTGECLKCIYNTGGFNCERCLAGFFGDALALPKGQCKSCDCYYTGSFGIECDQTTGQCDCLPFVVGRQCDQCDQGYWDLESGRGCQPCNCDSTGSTAIQCDYTTGQCPCLDGVGGPLCDQCLFDHYGFSSAGCRSCNCDRQGSAQLNCSSDGICVCKAGVIGEKCDNCRENHYNIALGCIPCPACYDLVQDRVSAHRDKLQQLEDLINNVGNNPEIVNDAEFEKRLAELEEDLDNTMIDAEEAAAMDSQLSNQLGDLQDSITALKEQISQILKNINMAEADSVDSAEEVAQAFVMIDRAKKALAEAQAYLDNFGWKTLMELNDTAKNMSEQALEMQDLAKQARDLAAGQVQLGGEIDGTAREAKATSEEALRLVQGTGVDSSIEDEIGKVEADYSDAEDIFAEASQLAEDSKTKADAVHMESTTLLAKAKQPLPTYEGETLHESAGDVKEKAQMIKDKADEVKATNQDLLAQVEQQAKEAAALLNDGTKAQQKLDLLMAKAHSAEAEAQAAKDQGEKTLQQAEKILEDLLGFNEKVETSKMNASEALLRIPEIEMKIDQANQTSIGAQGTIDEAKEDALKAREQAAMAEANATRASQGAENIKAAADDINKVAQGQNDRADSIQGNATQTMMELGALETQADDDSQLIQQAQMKANEAKRKADDATAAVQDALDDVRRLMDELNALSPVDPNRLQTIEDGFINVKRTYEFDLNIDQIMQRLRDAEQQQQGWINTYQFSLDDLIAQVENIQDISNSLPDFCPNFDRLENNGRR
ncbi:laminin subunit gamma-1-like [Acanthaster planci]|uniref:Laminin subunit gamma-1-like n=1 Tax=Acanthaster planci TaxID=133434 RepID=A0A8B7ZLI3_ACAPL|nr:laminin subunit gamma-1-like [Acanthaster planci]